MPEFSKPGYLLRGGVPLAMITEWDADAMSDDKEVLTLLLGLAGFSDGAAKVALNCKGVIPIAGLEYDIPALCLAHTTQDVSFKLAGLTTAVRGRWLNAKVSTSVNNPNAFDARFVGFVLARA